MLFKAGKLSGCTLHRPEWHRLTQALASIMLCTSSVGDLGTENRLLGRV